MTLPIRGRRAATACVLAGLALAAFAAPSSLRAAVGDEAGIGDTPVTSTWFALASPAAAQADRAYVAGMRPHHAGALSMSQEYLADPGRSSPLLQALARAIIVNQTYEIAVLDEVARNLDVPPLRLFGLTFQPVATEGLADRLRFLKAPVPSPFGNPIGTVSLRDVQFAKAMIIHHAAALEMARAYHANPAVRNGFLGLLNVDIIADQSQEIGLMRLAISAYPGNAALVEVDPSMVHGMEGMNHSSHGAAGHAAASPAEPGHGGAHAAHGAGVGTAEAQPPPAARRPAVPRPRPGAAPRPAAAAAQAPQDDHAHHRH